MRRDLAAAFRQLSRKPLFSGLAIALVALGLGLNLALFATVKSVLLDPLPFRDSDRLVHLWGRVESAGLDEYPFSWPNVRDLDASARSVEQIAAYRTSTVTFAAGERPVAVAAGRVTPNLLAVLGVEPARGRDFLAGVEGSRLEPSEPREVLLGWGLWRAQLGGREEVVGGTILLDGVPHTVAGILPPGFRFPEPTTELLVPFSPIGNEASRAFHLLRPIARLAPGVDLPTAGAELAALMEGLVEAYPDANRNIAMRVLPLHEQLVGKVRETLRGVGLAGGIVLLVAGLDVLVLLLLRNAARSRELGVRLALGAGPGALARQLVVEAAGLALAGAAVGLAAALLLVRWIRGFDARFLPRAAEVEIDPATALVGVGLVVGATAVFGLLPLGPAIRAAQARLRSGRGSAGARSPLRDACLAVQVALAVVLLFGAGLVSRSLAELGRVDPGFEVDGLVTAGLSLPSARYPASGDQAPVVRRAVDALAALPGVEAAASVNRLPFSPGDASAVAFRPDQEGQPGLPNASLRVVSPGYFAAVGLPLADGRDLAWSDDAAHATVAVVDTALAARLWPDRSPIGQILRIGQTGFDWIVVGTVPPVRQLRLDAEPGYAMYLAPEQNPLPAAMRTPRFVVRAAGEPRTIAGEVREALQRVAPDDAVLDLSTLDAQITTWLASRRTTALLLDAFGAVAIFLAAAGLYAAVAFVITETWGELAIRAALGASSRRLRGLAFWVGLRPVLVGAGLGAAGCVALALRLAPALFGVRPWEPAAIGAPLLILAAAVVFAVAPTARRIGRLRPAEVLRGLG